MTLFRGSGEVGSGEQIDYLRSKNNLSDVDNVPEARQNLGLDSLSSISGLTPADSTFIVGDGVNWVAESGATARTSLGLNNVPNIDTTDASNVELTDSENHYSNDNVESALEELGQSKVKIVDSVSDLQSGSFESGLDRIWLSGYYGVGTPGGGPLYRDSGDTTTADDGGTVFVDSNGVRWKRSEPIIRRQFEWWGVTAGPNPNDSEDTLYRIYVDPNNGDDSNTGETTGSAVKTIAEAVRRVPIVIDGYSVEIDLSSAPTLPVSYSEDVSVGPVQTSGTGSSNEGNIGQIRIIGDSGTPSNVKINSFLATGCLGPKVISLEGVEVQNEAPDPADANESAAVQFHSCNECGVSNIAFAANSIRRGVLAYTSIVDCRDVDATNITDHVLSAKRTGFITARGTKGTFSPSFDASGEPFEVREGSFIHYFNDSITYSGSGTPGGVVSDGGAVVDVDRELAWSESFKYFGVLAKASRATDLNFNAGSETRVSLDTVVSDTRAQVDVGNNWIDLTREGIYRVIGRFAFDTSSISVGDGIRIRIKDEDGTNLAESNYIYPGGTSVSTVTASVEATLDLEGASGNGLRLSAHCTFFDDDGGGATAVLKGSATTNEFSAEKLG